MKVALLYVLGTWLCSQATAQATKGVHPSILHRYEVGSDKLFECLNGSLKVPSERVNDDFCDCPDGSDEPGTSACPNGTFYCRNRGHVGKHLASAFVNDGVCDCCDGSDEERGCNNYCATLGLSTRLEKAAQLKEFRAGAEARESTLRDAEIRRASWAQEEGLLLAQIQELRPIVDSLQEAKQQVQAERDALLPHAAQMPEVADDDGHEDVEEPEEPVEWTDPRDPEAWDGEDPDHDAYHEAYRDGEHGEAYAGEEEHAEDAEADNGGEAEEEDPEEVGRRIAAQWTSNPEAAGPRDPVKPSAGEAAAVAPPQECANGGAGECANPDVVSDAASQAAAPAPAGAKAPSGGILDSVRNIVGGLFGKDAPVAEPGTDAEPGADAEAAAEAERLRQDVERRLGEASEKHSAQQQALTTAEQKLADLQAKIKRDHGPGGLFSYLDGSCFDWSDTKYRYQVCGFGDARQYEGGASTLLGHFSGFEDHHSVMQYTQGDTCWQGPARSLKVELKCSSTTQLLSVTEPSRCQYASTLLTPAACTPELVAQLAAELAELEAEAASAEA